MKNFYHWANLGNTKIFTNESYSVTEKCLKEAIKIERIRSEKGLEGLGIEFKKEIVTLEHIHSEDDPIDIRSQKTTVQNIYTSLKIK